MLPFLAGCFADNRNDNMVNDSFGLTFSSQIQNASVHTGVCKVGIAKAGKGKSAGTVYLDWDPDHYLPELEKYNTAHGTDYQAVMTSLIEPDALILPYSSDDIVKTVTLTWDPDQVARLIGDKTNFVIPILLRSDDLETGSGRNFMLIHLNRSGISLSQAAQARSIERKSVEADASGNEPVLTETITLDLVIDNPLSGVEMSLPVVIDNSLIDGFNQGREETYSQAPEGLVSLVDTQVTIPASGLSGSFRVLLDKSKLLDGGKLVDFSPYVIPVRVDTGNLSASKNGDAFDLRGLSYGNTVCYITVSPAAHGISVVVREWGVYSAENAWYSSLDGFAASADRTIAMDKNYVYVGHSNSDSPAIYALSRTNGSFVKKLDVSTAIGNGCTFPVSCVRVIRNTAGDDILTFCSLKGDSDQHLYVYAYVNGTDAAPTRILDFALDNKGGVEDWRRYGDRYTVEGTWQQGRLWFQTWSDGTYGKTIGFNISNGTVTNPADPEDHFISNPPAGIKDVVFYPGWDNVLVTTTTSAAFYKPGAAGANGWLAWDKTSDANDFALTYGYNFFDFHEQNFIAYMQLDGENAVSGRLVIIDDEGAAPADFPAQLRAQANRREFPIQHPDDFDAKSVVAAASSVGDCTVCEINGNTYIAVLMQGCGLSVFSLQ